MQRISDKGLGASLKESASALDERGRRVWVGAEPELRDAGRRFGYLMGAVVNAILLYLVSSPLVWRIPFLTEDFVKVLPILELSLTASVIANLAFVLCDPAWFRHLTRVGLSALAFAGTYALLTVFPFAFDNAGIEAMARLSLAIVMVCTAIAVIAEFFQFLFGWIRR